MAEKYLHHLMQLIGSKRILAAYEYMKELPANTAIPNKHNLFADLEAKVKEARVLARQVNFLLNKAAYPKALTCLHKVRRLVPDFPNINNDIDFIEGTMANLKQSLASAELAARRGDKKGVAELLNMADQIDRGNSAIPAIKKRLHKSVRRRRMRTMALTALIILTPFAYAGYEHKAFVSGDDHWRRARASIGNQEYKEAEAQMARARHALRNVRLLHQVDKQKLLNSVINMAASETFQQGLEGKVLHNGHFIDRTTQEQLDQIAAFSRAARENIARQKWSVALKKYQQALHVALSDEEYHHARISELRTALLQVRDTIYSHYKEQDEATLVALVEEGDRFFQERRWAEAMEAYGQALAFARQNRVADYGLVGRMGRARHEAEINNCLDEAEALMALNKQSEARLVFQRIITIIEENDLADLAALPLSRKMVARIDRELFVDKIRSLTARGEELHTAEKYDEALAHYREALVTLTENSQKYALDMAPQEEKIRKALAELDKQQTLAGHYRYLLATYQKIVRQQFNLSSQVKLQQPEVVFLKEEDNSLIYKISALGIAPSTAAGPSTRYEVDFKIDKRADNRLPQPVPTS
ncbi:MAG: hypothetical protein C0613_03945 [Desulfobulbaceae bacterium]|nr:MAG: hypothetical protein C0613_03945 [Desulfobulbaceae bacterium]